jgi:methyltransferase (TIGR00027 family)
MALARAHETAREEPLFVDRYAQMFVDDGARAGWEPPPSTADPVLTARMQALTDYAACRTKYFDDFFVGANADGVNQVVVLGSGLDSRPWRLPWGPDTVVYEIDQPDVLEFKIATLWDRNVATVCDHRPVPVDLREDWPAELRAAGFDESQPSAWSAEGLLAYLRADARDRLFDRIDALSVAGSRLAVEASSAAPPNPHADDRRRAVMRETRYGAAAEGNTTLHDVRAMWYPDGDTHLVDWLIRTGWRVTATEAGDLMAGYGRAPAGDAAYATPHSAFIDAVRLEPGPG